ncbi:hypothetical protein RRF57_008387 [Xylaria bambusicola]|uniref:Uncharacterized protein n=1 Tax=Xylaria bambusicola TaxID=326684 RepID=A0AAN7UTG2_9PEZI
MRGRLVPVNSNICSPLGIGTPERHRLDCLREAWKWDEKRLCRFFFKFLALLFGEFYVHLFCQDDQSSGEDLVKSIAKAGYDEDISKAL